MHFQVYNVRIVLYSEMNASPFCFSQKKKTSRWLLRQFSDHQSAPCVIGNRYCIRNDSSQALSRIHSQSMTCLPAKQTHTRGVVVVNCDEVEKHVSYTFIVCVFSLLISPMNPRVLGLLVLLDYYIRFVNRAIDARDATIIICNYMLITFNLINVLKC